MSKKIVFNTNLIYFLTMTLFIIIRICSNFGIFDFMGDYASFIMGTITQIGLIFLVPFCLSKILNKVSFKENFKFFNFKKVSWKTVLVSFVLGIVIFCINVYVSSFFNGIIQAFGYNPSSSSGSSLPATWWVLIINLFSTALLPAFCEESLHRGMLLKGYSSMGMRKSIIFSGLMFGLLHLNIEQFFYATLIGFFLGYLCCMCNSIVPCMIVHFMNNAISVFLSFASVKGWGIGNVFNFISGFLSKNFVLGMVFFVLLLCLFVVLAIELTKFLMKESFRYNFGKKQKELTDLAIRESYFKQIENIKNNSEEKPLFRSENNNIIVDLKG